MKDYVRDTLRKDDADSVEEYQIRVKFNYKVTDSSGKIVVQQTLSAVEEYALVGAMARTESAALSDLLDEAARKITESIIEAW